MARLLGGVVLVITDDGAREGDALLHAAAELRRVQVFHTAQADLTQRPRHKPLQGYGAGSAVSPSRTHVRLGVSGCWVSGGRTILQRPQSHADARMKALTRSFARNIMCCNGTPKPSDNSNQHYSDQALCCRKHETNISPRQAAQRSPMPYAE